MRWTSYHIQTSSSNRTSKSAFPAFLTLGLNRKHGKVYAGSTTGRRLTGKDRKLGASSTCLVLLHVIITYSTWWCPKRDHSVNKICTLPWATRNPKCTVKKGDSFCWISWYNIFIILCFHVDFCRESLPAVGSLPQVLVWACCCAHSWSSDLAGGSAAICQEDEGIVDVCRCLWWNDLMSFHSKWMSMLWPDLTTQATCLYPLVP